MDPIKIIKAIYHPGSRAYRILIDHGRSVAEKAAEAASRVKHLDPDLDFIDQAALLHDIGMVFTDSPGLGCSGKHPYICHGVMGRKLLEERGFPTHALVCERHVGVGITIEDIDRQALPLPRRDMRPQSIEEKIICYADTFFSKGEISAGREKSPEQILRKLEDYGTEKVKQFQLWQDLFTRTNHGH